MSSKKEKERKKKEREKEEILINIERIIESWLELMFGYKKFACWWLKDEANCGIICLTWENKSNWQVRRVFIMDIWLCEYIEKRWHVSLPNGIEE